MQHLIDRLIINFDQSLRTFVGSSWLSHNPAEMIEEEALLPAEKRLSARLMRVNHAGEVAAQGLYQGQALTAHSDKVRHQFYQSAREESDHLFWCQKRVEELGGQVSWLSPFWYVGSLSIGVLATLPGDRWSLGFMAETERQVIKHLDNHLQRLSPKDMKSRVILEKLKQDEARHAAIAMKLGGRDLPLPVKWLMGGVAKVMTTTAFWL